MKYEINISQSNRALAGWHWQAGVERGGIPKRESLD